MDPAQRRVRRLGQHLSAAALDPEALRRKYREERDKRLKAQEEAGQGQYILDLDKSERWASLTLDPYAAEDRDARAPLVGREMDALCVGAGFGGLLSAARMKMKGVAEVCIVDKGSDVAGTWYWNQYPGAACDVEAWSYMPMLEELGVGGLPKMPSHKYVKGAEIIQHCNAIVDKFELREGLIMQTKVTGAAWDEARGRWVVTTDRGDKLLPRYLINSSGPLAKPKLAKIGGMESFTGRCWHTSRWDYAFTGRNPDTDDPLPGLRGLRVGIIGTGATAVQVIPNLAKSAAQLYVFQRTPSSIDVRDDFAWDRSKWAAKNAAPGSCYQRRHFFDLATSGGFLAQETRNSDKQQGARGVAKNKKNKKRTPEEIAEAKKKKMARINFGLMQRIRDRIDAVVDDQATADALKPWYDMGCKRPCFHDEFLPSFNRPNVELVHTDGKGIKVITAAGPVFEGRQFEVDALVYATGFETQSTFVSRTGYDFVGRGGVKLGEKWASEGLSTLWGMHAHGFPNLYIVGMQGQSAFPFNYVSMLDEQAAHVAAAVAAAGGRTMDVTSEAEAEWVSRILSESTGSGGQGGGFLSECTPGYYNNEGKIAGEGRIFPQNANWSKGAPAYYELLRRFRNADPSFGSKFEFR